MPAGWGWGGGGERWGRGGERWGRGGAGRERRRRDRAPVLLRGVLEQLGQLQRVLADLLHGREEEAVDGDVDHLLQQAARLEEVPVPALRHQAGELRAGARVVVTVLGVDGKALLLARGKHSFVRLWGTLGRDRDR